jgi:hypothetical protein
MAVVVVLVLVPAPSRDLDDDLDRTFITHVGSLPMPL